MHDGSSCSSPVKENDHRAYKAIRKEGGTCSDSTSISRSRLVGVLLGYERARRMNYMRLLKLLYLAVREFLLKTGHTITGDHAGAMKRGPVSSQVYDLIRGLSSPCGGLGTPDPNRTLRGRIGCRDGPWRTLQRRGTDTARGVRTLPRPRRMVPLRRDARMATCNTPSSPGGSKTPTDRSPTERGSEIAMGR